MPRLVLITNDSAHGQRVLHALWTRGVVVDDVLFMTGSVTPPRLREAGIASRLARWPRFLAGTIRRTWRFHRHRKALYAMRCRRVRATGLADSARLLRHLRELAPDWIVLGGGGIVGPAVIGAARHGVLNAHPGLLPWARGNGVVAASLAHGVALGATVHLVDEGIDTGPVVARRLLAPPPGTPELAALELATEELAATLLADVVEDLAARGAPVAAAPQEVRYPLFRWPDAAVRREAGALAATGRAQALHDAWLPLASDPARGDLPGGPLAAPSVMTLRPLPPAR